MATINKKNFDDALSIFLNNFIPNHYDSIIACDGNDYDWGTKGTKDKFLFGFHGKFYFNSKLTSPDILSFDYFAGMGESFHDGNNNFSINLWRISNSYETQYKKILSDLSSAGINV